MIKKISKVVLNIVLISFILVSGLSIGVKAILKIKFDKNINYLYTTKENLNIDYKAYIKTDGNIKSSKVDYVNKILNVIPKDVLNAFFNKGGVVVITDKDIAKTYYNNTSLGRIAGLFSSRESKVYITDNIRDIDGSLLHEFGHVLDYMTGRESYLDEFKAIYNSEKDTFKVYSHDGHYKSNEQEFFAEVFQESILNPTTCKESAKNAFNFVNSKLKDIEVS